MKKDNKGRILKTGEDQLKDGRYRFRYTDLTGSRRDIYSWKLLSTDKTPKGKRECVSLREKENQITVDTASGINTYQAGKITVLSLLQDYLHTKRMKDNTRHTYDLLLNKHVIPAIGHLKVSNIKPSTIRNLYSKIAESHSRSTIDTINAVLYPAFESAVLDGIIRVNPAKSATNGLDTKCEKDNKRSLTLDEQKELLSFIRTNHPFWFPLFTVAIQTGMRAGELTALTWNDVDFENNTIEINKTMIRGNYDGQGCHFRINSPKTESSKRIITMLPGVRKALSEQRIKAHNDMVICGYTDFIFATEQGKPISQTYINSILDRIIKAHNEEELMLAEQNGAEPFILPAITSHWFRYTCCTRFCENAESIDEVKAVAKYLGHKKLDMTLDVYLSTTKQKEEELQRRVQANAFA